MEKRSDYAPGNYIYLDHNATTPLDPYVTEAIGPFLREEFGNPSSPYPLGCRAKEALEKARMQVASLIGAGSEEIVFTSGGSESNNSVLKGLIDFRRPGDFHMITSSVEHPAILNPALYLMELGARITVLRVDRFGTVDPADVQKAIRPDTRLISVMLANNETGTIEPIREISKIARENGIRMHTDAAQAVGKIPVNVDELGVDLLSIAGHKLYAPKGVGALFVRRGIELTPLIHGAAQEGGKRAGTESTILTVALGAACRIAGKRLLPDMKIMTEMRDRLQERLFESIEGLVLNGHPVDRLPNTLSVCVPRLEGGRILEGLPMIMASTGAACHDRSVTLSHVLSAMSVPPQVGMGALRFTLGRSNTMGQVEEAADLIAARIRKLRETD